MASIPPPRRYPLAGLGAFRVGPCWACVSTVPTIPRMRFAPTSESSASIPPPRYRRPAPRTLSRSSSREILSPSAYPDPGAPFVAAPSGVAPSGLYPAHPGPACAGFGYPLHAVSLTPEPLRVSFSSQRPWGSPFRAFLPGHDRHPLRSALLSCPSHQNPPAWVMDFRGFRPQPEPYA
jgi:hypothetical protein